MSRNPVTSLDPNVYAQLFENFEQGLVMIDTDHRIVHANEAARKLFRIADVTGERNRVDHFLNGYAPGAGLKKFEARLYHNPEDVLYVTQYPIGDGPSYSGKILLIDNITEQRSLEKTLRQEYERAQTTLQCVHDAVIMTDINGMIDYLNPVAETYTGWRQDEAHGFPLSVVFSILDETTRCPLPDPVAQCLREGRVIRQAGHSLLIQRDGHERAIEYTIAPLPGGGDPLSTASLRPAGAVLVFRDVSHIVGMARQMAYQASHDALTDLPNRSAFEAHLVQSLHHARQDQTQHVLCYLDLDQFKIVNDTCGHMAGDQLLKQLTALLRSKIRHTDVLSRLGGDEFGLILRGCPMHKARQVAEELCRSIRNVRFTWHDKAFEIGASIGLVPITAESGEASELLSAADAACYVAKEQGRNRVQVYQPDETTVLERHSEMQWVHRITRALRENRFCLYYQLIRPLGPKAAGPTHGEVLIRMVDENGGLVPPIAFIPAAERFNLMSAVDRWVIRTALAVMAEGSPNPQAVSGNGVLSINVSGQSLGDDRFLEFVIDRLHHSQVPPERLCFEITETAAITHLERAIHFMTRLRELGCRFALDDFGSGLSSFAYLKRLPVDYLKIDGSFVKGMLEDPIDEAMVTSINQLGHVLGIRTIAEFVETEAVMARLEALGVDYAQGYGIAKPRPLTPIPT